MALRRRGHFWVELSVVSIQQPDYGLLSSWLLLMVAGQNSETTIILDKTSMPPRGPIGSCVLWSRPFSFCPIPATLL